MSGKYQIKLKNEKVIGPFVISKVGELFLDKKITKDDLYSFYPDIAWKKSEEFVEIRKLFQNIEQKIITRNDLEMGKKESETLVNISLGVINESHSPQEYTKETELKTLQAFEFSEEQTRQTDSGNQTKTMPEDATVIRGKIEDVHKDLDKTIIRPRVYEAQENKLENSEAENSIKNDALDIEDNKEIETQTSAVVCDAKTEMINLATVLPEISNEAQRAEIEENFSKQKEEYKEDEIRPERLEKDLTTVKNTPFKKKGMKPIVALCFIAAFWMIFFDDDNMSKGGADLALPDISIPAVEDVENKEDAKRFFDQAMPYLQRYDYSSKVMAASLLKKSLEKSFRQNRALGYLIKVYAELLPDTTDKSKAVLTISKLIDLSRGSVASDLQTSLGVAIYYYHLQKYQTATDVLDRYLRYEDEDAASKGVARAKLSSELLSYMALIALNAGDLTTGKKALDKLSNAPEDKPLISYFAKVSFDRYTESAGKAYITLKNALDIFPESFVLLLFDAEFALEKEDFRGLEKTLKKIRKIGFEKSPIYYARYLEFLGMLQAKKNDLKGALTSFKTALKIRESDELRSKFASLETGGVAAVDKLINESKIIRLMSDAKVDVHENRKHEAMTKALLAVDLDDRYIPAQLFLANMQIKNGFFKESILTLERISRLAGSNPRVLLALANAYVESYRFEDAEKTLNLAATIDGVVSSHLYASVRGRLFEKTNNLVLAIRWLNSSIKRNPINDADLFLLAKIFIKIRQYDRCKKVLLEAINLDPQNMEYRGLFAKILSELESTDSAIGYLQELLNRNPGHPKLIGDLAILYCGSNQIKFCDQYKNKIKELSRPDENFYRFMISLAKQDRRIEDVILYAEELARLDPSDIESHVLLGEYYLLDQNPQKALDTYLKVAEKLEKYPKINYLIAKLYISSNMIKEAYVYAKKEIEHNPNQEYGYYARGLAFFAEEKFFDAAKDFEMGISKNSRSVECLMGLADIKYRQRQFADARELYLRILQEDLSIAEAHKKMGYVLKQMGQPNQAIESFNTALKLITNDREKAQIQQEINKLK